jgi:hypothetical protein
MNAGLPGGKFRIDRESFEAVVIVAVNVAPGEFT